VRQSSGWDFNYSAENEARLKPLCIEVAKHFCFPVRRLYRYFARTDDHYMVGPPMSLGEYYRAFHIPLSSKAVLPLYLSECFFHPIENFTRSPLDKMPSFEQMVAFDNLIFIRDSTCLDPTGFVTTYAHKLQHFLQHGHTPRLAVVNSDLYFNMKRFAPSSMVTDVPNEREANIVSKRVAEAICGTAAVRAFAEERIGFMETVNEPDQRERWIFFRDVPASTEYDFLAETIPLVEKYKGQIEFSIDVRGLNGGLVHWRISGCATDSYNTNLRWN
jgi:hypothetical protein